MIQMIPSTEREKLDDDEADERAWQEARRALGDVYLLAQSYRVGPSKRYPKRPRYWYFNGVKVYASMMDWIG